MSQKQSEKLTAFYRDYRQWLNHGCPRDFNFTKDIGLCRASVYYTGDYSIHNEMKIQFMQAGLDDLYPFNKDSKEYNYECGSYIIHKNPARIKWVLDHCYD